MLDSIIYACMCAWYLVLLVAALVVLVVLACFGVAGVYAVFVNCIVPTTNNWKVNNVITKKELLEIDANAAKIRLIGAKARKELLEIEATPDKVRLNDAKVRKEQLEIKDITAKEADEQNMEILEKW